MKKIISDKILIDQAEFCVIDIETTGSNPYQDRIIEIGIVKIKNCNIIEQYQSFVNPGLPIPYFISQLTGITNSDVKDAPFFDEIAPEISAFIGGSIFVAHNAQFDYPFLKKELSVAGYEMLNEKLCTLRLCRRVYYEIPSKSLGSVAKHLHISQKDAHRALSDSLAAAKILLKIINKLTIEKKFRYLEELLSYQNQPIMPEGVKLNKMIVEDLASCPQSPGIYYFKKKKETVVYVGKAKCLKDRVGSYFSTSAGEKSKKIVRSSERLSFQKTNSELTALLAEAELIKQLNPRFNSLLKRYGNNYFLKIDLANEYPTVSIARRLEFDGNDYFGPFNKRESVEAFHEIINKSFLLRECSEKEYHKKKECFLSHIHRCYAPCINSNLKEDYSSELGKVYEFLSGANHTAVERLVAKMKSFSEKQRFEEAAQIKETIDLVLMQTHKTSILSEPINSANALIEVNGYEEKDYILLLSGKIYIRNYFLDKKNEFEDALNYFYEDVRFVQSIQPDEESLEKIKIALNWLIRNRNKMKVYYLKNYASKDALLKSINIPNKKELEINTDPFRLSTYLEDYGS
ncbi:MAG TPA: exonuclease domain-containing protein [Ignavibacteriales bacterium]|nr:exonuclease domain-containing protein [Ignavibacteriales bacterium]